MSSDPLLKLQAAIALAAQEREKKNQISRDEQIAREKLRDQAKDVWGQRKKELPSLVQAISDMLRQHGYEGLTIRSVDSKHSDVDRVAIDFAHSLHSHTQILLCVTTAGEFTCTAGVLYNDTGKIKIPIEELSEDRLTEVLAKAVEECLAGKRDQRSG
jgi:hypothetical protein